MIGHVNRMDSKITVSQVFNNNPKGIRRGDDQEAEIGVVYKQILINKKLQIGKKGKENRVDWAKSIEEANCSDIEEEEEEEEKNKKRKKKVAWV